MWGFLVYAVTAAVTACDLLYLLFWSTFGRPVHVLEYFALLAAILLVIAAYVSLWKRQVAAQLALAAALVEWAFYLPALRTTLSGNTPIALYGRAGVFAGLALVFLLVATTYSAAIAFWRPGEAAPTHGSKRVKMIVYGGTAVMLAVAGLGTFLIGARRAAQSFDIVLPVGYRGWVRIDFAATGARALGKGNHGLLVPVPSSGIVETSTELQANEIENRYRYNNESDPVKVAAAFLVQRTTNDKGLLKSEYFFVGDGMSQSNEPNGEMPVPGPIGPVPSNHVR